MRADLIISDKHRYVFIQIPHTASTAIAEELIRYYDGRPILKKHSYIPEFERFATPKQKDYFVFGSIRNPLDERVSSYWKLRSDHLRIYSHEGDLEEGVERRASGLGRRRFRYLQTADDGFEAYFRKFCRYTYDTPISLRKERYDKVMRYEKIAEEFEGVLTALDIKPVRRLPASNRTAGRDSDFERYYTRAMIRQATRVFGPFMREWGYSWPDDWNEYDIPWISEIGYRFWGGVRRTYWRTIGRTAH